LLVQVERYNMVFLEIFDFPLLVNKLALPVLHILLRDDPVVVYLLSLLLKKSYELLFLLHRLLHLSKLFPNRKFVLL